VWQLLVLLVSVQYSWIQRIFTVENNVREKWYEKPQIEHWSALSYYCPIGTKLGTACVYSARRTRCAVTEEDVQWKPSYSRKSKNATGVNFPYLLPDGYQSSIWGFFLFPLTSCMRVECIHCRLKFFLYFGTQVPHVTPCSLVEEEYSPWQNNRRPVKTYGS
jgi:hypothetical protein